MDFAPLFPENKIGKARFLPARRCAWSLAERQEARPRRSGGVAGAKSDVTGKLIMEIPPKLKEYLDTNRGVYIDNNRCSLPPVTDPDEPLQIDSLALVRLVAFLENDLGYRVEDEELIAENFATLRSLGELLATKTPIEPTREARDVRNEQEP